MDRFRFDKATLITERHLIGCQGSMNSITCEFGTEWAVGHACISLCGQCSTAAVFQMLYVDPLFSYSHPV